MLKTSFNNIRSVFNLEVKIRDHIIRHVTQFKYLGSLVQTDGEVERDVKHRIQTKLLKWRRVSRVLCDMKVPITLKEYFYRTTIRL